MSIQPRKILAVLDRNIVPCNSGVTYPVANQLKYLSQFFEIDLLVASASVNQTLDCPDWVSSIRFIQPGMRRSRIQRGLAEIFGAAPYFALPNPTSLPISANNRSDYAYIYASPISIAGWAKQLVATHLPQSKTILNINDSLTLSFRRFQTLLGHPGQRPKNQMVALINSVRAMYMPRIERTVLSGFDHVFVQSIRDRDCAERFLGNNAGKRGKVSVVSNGFKSELTALKYGGSCTKTLIHVGALSPDRADLLEWFVLQVFRDLRKRHPNLCLRLVGNIPQSYRVRFQNIDGVVLNGFVDDMREVLSTATIAIAPLFMNCGLVNKVLDGMAAGIPTVGSGVFHGFPEFRNGYHGFDVTTKTAWIEVIDRLLNNPQELCSVSARARELVVRNHSWENTFRNIHEVLNLPEC